MPFDLKPGSLFFIAFGSAIAGLLFGSELVRWIMAGALAVVAVPLWKAIGSAFFSRRLNDSEHTLDLILAGLIGTDDHQAKP